MFDTILETASSILSASLGAVNIDLSKIKDALAKVDINSWIICFDDLERCSLPVNEILGFINRLVEHNHCKVIILANEKEIGALNLNSRLEEKYQVILAGKRLKTGDADSNNNDSLDIEQLRKETKQLFNEDILYKSIREKVIGLSIVYDLQLTTEIGFVPLGNSLFSSTKGFKFLEKYCTTLSFSDEEFIKAVSMLRNEYEEEERKLKKMKEGFGKAYGNLSDWREKEDSEVISLIEVLRTEIKEDKYPFHSYQGIISQFLILEAKGFDIGNMDDIVSYMNNNIEKDDGEVDFEIFGHTFKENPELKRKYDRIINKLKLKAGNKNQTKKISEISTLLNTEEWAEKLLDYCDKHFNDFLARYGFIDLIDTDLLFEKIKNASTKEIYIIIDCFKEIYKPGNINEFFTVDKEKIIELRRKLDEWVPDGINKPEALRVLKEYLDDIIKRLEKEIEYIRI